VYSFITVTKATPKVTTCEWCGGEVFQSATGRPRSYCRDAHRQRAYEARRLGWRIGLGPGEAVVSQRALTDLGDRITILEAALEDVREDLSLEPGPAAYENAFRHLYEAAEGLRGQRLQARAVAPDP
jgi:hypothetical protein